MKLHGIRVAVGRKVAGVDRLAHYRGSVQVDELPGGELHVCARCSNDAVGSHQFPLTLLSAAWGALNKINYEVIFGTRSHSGMCASENYRRSQP